MNQQVIRNLKGHAADPSMLDGDIFDVAVMLPAGCMLMCTVSFAFMCSQSLLLCMFHGDSLRRRSNAPTRGGTYHQQLPAVPLLGTHNLCYSLALLEHYSDATSREQRAYRKQLAANQGGCGAGRGTPHELSAQIRAGRSGLARVLGKDAAAGATYDRAIEGAHAMAIFRKWRSPMDWRRAFTWPAGAVPSPGPICARPTMFTSAGGRWPRSKT